MFRYRFTAACVTLAVLYATAQAPAIGHATTHTVKSKPAVVHVSIQNFAFVPAKLAIKAGTTVIWTNRDAAAHTVTFSGTRIDSGPLPQGKNFRYTFKKPGTYSYLCTIHPFMLATLTVRR